MIRRLFICPIVSYDDLELLLRLARKGALFVYTNQILRNHNEVPVDASTPKLERRKKMKGFVKIPNSAFDLELSSIEFHVLCYLLKCRNSVTGKCFLSKDIIAG